MIITMAMAMALPFCPRFRRRHRRFLSLLLLHTTACLLSTATAFSVKIIKRKPPRPIPSTSSAPVPSIADGGGYSPAHRLGAPHVHRGKMIGYSDLRKSLHLWSMSFISMIASATIMLSPYPSDAYIYESYPTATWPSSVIIASDASSMTPSYITELGLKPPTEGKPQIMFEGRSDSLNTNAREPILQGLVYFPERSPRDVAAESPSQPQTKQQLDYYSDILVLTAVSAAHPEGPVLAGAKFPVSSVRFPFSFQMYKENLLANRPGVQREWESVDKTGDVILRAHICPIDVTTLPCDANETKKYAEGVAKLITNLPGLQEGQTIRAPASLPLE
ncbi:hypothetical protein ACHAWF_005198 [Thalassiosira exigua]